MLLIVGMSSQGAMCLHNKGWQLLARKELGLAKNVMIERGDSSNFYWIFLELPKIIFRLKPKKVIFLNGEYNPASIFYVLLLRAFNIDVLVTWHDVTPHIGSILNYIYWCFSLITAKSSSAVIVHNQSYTKNPYLLNKKVYYIPLPHFYSTPSNKYLANKDGSVVFVGRIERYKGLERVLEVYRRAENLNSYRKLIILGSGSYDYVSKLKLVECANVEFTGYVNDELMSNYLAKASAVIMPYLHCSQSLNIYWAEQYSASLIVSSEVDESLNLSNLKGCYVFNSYEQLDEILNKKSQLTPLRLTESFRVNKESLEDILR